MIKERCCIAQIVQDQCIAQMCKIASAKIILEGLMVTKETFLILMI